MHNILAREVTAPDCHPELPMSQFFHQGGWGKGAMSVEEANLLHSLILNYKPKSILETGTENGYTASVMGHACRENGFGFVTSLELHEEQAIEARSNIIDVHLDEWVEILTYDSLEFIKNNLDMPVDFALIDSTIGLRMEEIHNLIPKMKRGGMIVTHDTSTLHPARERYDLQLNIDRLGFPCMHIPSPRGISIIQIP